MNDGFQATGPFDRGTYVDLTYQIHTQGRSGVLRIEHGKRFREIFYVGGLPVHYRTSLPEEQLKKTLIFSNLVSKSRLTKLVNRLDENTPLEEALLKSRLVRRAQLNEHMLTRLLNGIGAPLHWTKGSWTFQVHSQLEAVRIDLELLPRLSVLNCLWTGVKQHISMDAVMSMVRSSAPQPATSSSPHKIWAPCGDIEKKLAAFNLEPPFDQLKDVLGDGGEPDAIMAKITDSSGNLVKLLWLLESIGILSAEGAEVNHANSDALQSAAAGRFGQEESPSESEESESKPETRSRKRRRRASSDRSTRRDRSSPSAHSSAKAVSSLSPTERLDKDHRERLNSDYYVFLGLRPDASKEEIESTSRRLAQLWRSAVDSHSIDERAQQQAKELLGGLRQVWSVLKDEASRKGYDLRLSSGRAPMVRTETSTELNQILGDLPGSSQKQSPDTVGQNPLDQGLSYLESNNFQAAYRVLEVARQKDPSCPDTLAALGWAAYHVKHQAKLDDDPEDYLRLALTFHPTHIKALEYHARISLKKGALEQAEAILTQLVKLNPKATWAQRELSQIRSAQSRDNNRRFWRKGDDG